jgi:hypothetical protein
MTKSRTRQSNGTFEQHSFLPELAFCPKSPYPNSAEYVALLALLEGELTQIEWLKRSIGWRLDAAIQELDYLGWEPESIPLKRDGWPKPIAFHQLPVKAKRLVKQLQSRGKL